MGHQEEIPELLEDRLIFYRERSANAYNAFSYYLSNFIIQIPIDVLNIFLYSIILYSLCDLRGSIDENAESGGDSGGSNSHYLFFMYIMLITNYSGLFICQLISYCSPSTDVAMSLFPVVLFFVTAFEGFIVYLPEFPGWLSWLANVSYLRFSFQALVLNELQGNDDNLPLESYYISQLGFDTISKTTCGLVMFVFLGLHALLTYLAVRYVNFEKR
jgi:ABC-type multidrug transport system permease subunit